MGTTKTGLETVRVLVKNNSGSYSVSLPIGSIRDLGWQQGQKVVIKKQGKKLIIEDWSAK